MKLYTRLLVLSSIGAALAGCASVDTRSAARTGPVAGKASVKPGGYYKDDGPGANPPADLASIPNAVPRDEPLHRFANRPYRAMGANFVPLADASGYKATGLASWYGRRYHGQRTSSGEVYDMYAMTAAHPTLPIPSYARVTNPANGRSVVVRINDRGPFHADRLIDLSYTAAWKLDLLKGVGRVEVESIAPGAAVVATASNEVVTTPLPPLASLGAPATMPEPVTAGAEPAAAETPPRFVNVDPAPASPEVSAATGVATTPTAGSATTAVTYLQLGAFSNGDAVDRLQTQVQAHFGDSLPGIHRLPAGTLVKLQVGPFTSLAEANQIAQRLEQEIGIRPYRVVR